MASPRPTIDAQLRDLRLRVGQSSGGGIPVSEKGAANGVATLDGTGKVPAAQLPAGGGGGDMMQAVYDPGGNGIVDNAETLQGHPAADFALAGHNHDAAYTALALPVYTAAARPAAGVGQAGRLIRVYDAGAPEQLQVCIRQGGGGWEWVIIGMASQ